MLRQIMTIICALALLGPAQTAAQTLDPTTLIEGLSRVPAVRGLNTGLPAAEGPDATDQAFLESLPVRGLSVEARTQLAAITTTWDLPRVDVEILFDFDSDRLRREAWNDLLILGDALTSAQLKARRFVLAGHTDGVGSAEYNQDLSERRAAAVRAFLLERFPIAPERLISVGFGFERLKNIYDPRAAENRRVEVINLEVGNY